jgi:hypothetical protein
MSQKVMLVQVRAPHFTAGLVLTDDRCTQAAPILRRIVLGKTPDELRATFRRRGWTAVIVPEHREFPPEDG